MLQRRSHQGVTFYVSPLLEAAEVPHAFSTRLGGVSVGPLASLNLGNPAGAVEDPPQNIAENYRRLLSAIGQERRKLCRVQQVHGTHCLLADPEASEPWDELQQADAILTSHSDRLLAVRTADCVPILLSSGDGQAVAVVHAGWRGVIAGIVPKSVRRLAELCPPGSAENFLAAIGPCIGPDAFEVGPEVLSAFRQAFGDAAPIIPGRAGEEGKGWVDLAAAVRTQLIESGLLTDRIDRSDRCTSRDAEEFFSHRRDRGLSGRMAAVIGCR